MVYALPYVLPTYHGAVWHTIPYFSIQEKFYFRQYRIILSADTASEVRQMLSQKRR